MFELVKKDKPQYAHRDMVEYNKEASDRRYAEMERKFKEEAGRIRQSMADLHKDMSLMRIELDQALVKLGIDRE